LLGAFFPQGGFGNRFLCGSLCTVRHRGFFLGEQVGLPTGHDRRSLCQPGELLSGCCVFFLPGTDLVNLVQVAAFELLSQVVNAGPDFWSFWHALQTLTLFDQISILTGTLKP
jgi:hypothetical protein